MTSKKDLICSVCSKPPFFGKGDKYYCVKCWYDNTKICSDCFMKKRTSDFGCHDYCYACSFKRTENYESNIVPNIIDIFDEFKSKYPKYKNAIVPNDDEFKMLSKTLDENFDIAYWFKCFVGIKNDFKDVPLFFTHEQAKELCQIVTSKKCENWHDFIQAMSSSLLLIRLITSIDELSGPYRWADYIRTKDEIMNLWGDKFSCLRQIASFELVDCAICLTSIDSSDAFVMCNQCKNITHYKCKFDYFTSVVAKEYSCEFCRCKYINDDDISIYNYSVFNSSGKV